MSTVGARRRCEKEEVRVPQRKDRERRCLNHGSGRRGARCAGPERFEPVRRLPSFMPKHG